mmetsp:Transcript_102224/g.288795  ORF Transcript_102224/g.288795 Transcript_102224/m.288795 type:complete len:219 (+) Transcript_102224:93-749(+)
MGDIQAIRELSRSRSAPSHLPRHGGPTGFYEVLSGLAVLHSEPSVSASKIGALKAGVRFFGDGPYQVGGRSWLKARVRHDQVPSFTPAASNVRPNKVAFKSNDAAMNIYKATAQLPLFTCHNDEKTEVWVEANSQYIRRVRSELSGLGDRSRDEGIACGVGPLKVAHREMLSTKRRRGPPGLWCHSTLRPHQPPVIGGAWSDVNMQRHSIVDPRSSLK